jgi:NADH-quinone oxidoreductase subunit A
MPDLVLFILIFLAAGGGVLATNLLLGKLVRPHRPSPEKGTVYECGEPTIGSAWVQFDLRFYVVALLFVIFDVELAFFFPWAVVFGSANQLADPGLAATQRDVIEQRLRPPGVPGRSVDPVEHVASGRPAPPPTQTGARDAAAAKTLAWVAFGDLLVFFGVLLVGFAYLWRRGDLAWVRSYAAQTGDGVSEPRAGGAGSSLTPATLAHTH